MWDDIIKEVDMDGNGEISFEEFKMMMQKILGAPQAAGSFVNIV